MNDLPHAIFFELIDICVFIDGSETWNIEANNDVRDGEMIIIWND